MRCTNLSAVIVSRPTPLFPRHCQLRAAAIIAVEVVVNPVKAGDGVVDEDEKFARAGGLDVGLDFIVVGIGIEKNLFAADAAVTQHYPEPVLRQFSSQRHAKAQQNPMIPNRWIVGGESAIRNRNASISPGYRRLDLHMISRATAFEKNPRRLAKVRRVELDRSRLRICLGVCRAPCEARSVAALFADQSGHILDIVKQVAAQRKPEIHEQQRKERRRPPALQAVMKPYVGPIDATPGNAA